MSTQNAEHHADQDIDPEERRDLFIVNGRFLRRGRRKTGCRKQVQDACDDRHHRHETGIFRLQQPCCNDHKAKPIDQPAQTATDGVLPYVSICHAWALSQTAWSIRIGQRTKRRWQAPTH
jgi:hypothetical protein